MNKLKILYIEQGSDEWHRERDGKLTGSYAAAIGNRGAGLKTYVSQICARMRRINDIIYSFKNAVMERGNEFEKFARMAYEIEAGLIITEVGIGIYSDYVAASPDGLIGEDGGVEIKCRNDEKHFKYITTGKVESATIWQINMNMLVFGRKWWDFVSYNPDYKKPLFIKRFEPDPIMQNKLLAGFKVGEKMIKEQLKLYDEYEVLKNEE